MLYSDYPRHIDWQLRFALLPHRSAASQQRIWFRPAYRGRRMLHGPGEPVIIDYWLTPEEFVVYQLKKENND
jgi:hypothetical protein